MSDKITNLPDGGAVQDTDEFVAARAGANVKIAGSALGTGGGSSSIVVHGPYPFSFDSPGILTEDGFPLGFTPTVGDLLLDAFVKITTAWDGTTPKADIGPGLASARAGLWNLISWNHGIDMTHADDDMSSPPIGLVSAYSQAYTLSLSQQCILSSLKSAVTTIGSFVPMFATSDISEFAVAVAQDGFPGGADPGSTHGAAEAYFLTATPQT